jgi:FcoT-like thioesterase domain
VSRPVAHAPGGVLADDPALRERVLNPYREHCRYLRSIEVRSEGDGVRATGEFGVEQSYYIDSTGHFNAVEYNICYNQAAYYLIAQSIRHRLLPAFADWSIDDFWDRQLGNVLIVEFSTIFQQQISPRKFNGELSFGAVMTQAATPTSPPLIAIDTKCRFWDATGGKCQGRALLAVTNPPEPGR